MRRFITQLITQLKQKGRKCLLINQQNSDEERDENRATDLTLDPGVPNTRRTQNMEGSVPYPEPPNIQLNISKNQSEPPFKEELEMLVAVSIAVTIQCGLICIAAITVFHQGVRNAIGVQAEVFGFPCYAAGSVLLSVGIAICSVAIGQSTGEHEWINEDEHDKPGGSPQLMFLQQGQSVQVSNPNILCDSPPPLISN